MNHSQPSSIQYRESSIEYPVIYVPISHLYICREPSTNQLLFMQNKPNVKDAQINVNSYMKSKYEKMDTWLSGQNKPKQSQSVVFSKLVPAKAGILRRLSSVLCFLMQPKLLNFHRKNSLTVGTNSVKLSFLCSERECFYEELYGEKRAGRAEMAPRGR